MLISEQGFIGNNTKEVIELLQGWEFIPLIISHYHKRPDDPLLLTLLTSLMKQADYYRFKSSALYKELYVDTVEKGLRGIDYTYRKESIPNTILSLAKEYYNSKLKQ